jgi:hypothetical protein
LEFIEEIFMCKNCCCKKSCAKFFILFVIVIALALAVMISFWHEKALPYIITISRFFDVMIPVLGAGALIKYLLFGGGVCNCGSTCCSSGEKGKEKDSCCSK